MTLTEFFQQSFALNALVVSVLIALCAALIGVPLVLRRYAFIGDGLSHISFGAMALAAVINITDDLYFIMPVTILIAIFLLSAGKNAKIKGEAALAMMSVGALAFGYFIINVFSVKKDNIAGDVCSSLFGSTSILTLKDDDVWLCFGMALVVIVLYVVFYNKIFAVTFDSDFMKATGGSPKIYEIVIATVIAIVISLSMRLVGSLLTSALVIFPAVSAMRLFKNFKSVVICSAAVSAVCALFGIFLANFWGTPVGATIVIANIVVFGIFYAFSKTLAVRRR